MAATDASPVDRHRQVNGFPLPHDPLTGLPGRPLFLDRVAEALARARRHGRQGALLLIDLDRFEALVEDIGPTLGDAVLQQVACRFSECVREVDTVARLGEDDFCVLSEDLNGPEDAAVVAQKLLNVLAPPFFVGGRSVYVSASIGIACWPGDADDGLALMRRADIAVSRARRRGRNWYQYYAAGMSGEPERSRSMLTGLHKALSQDEMRVRYQPVIDLRSGRVSGLEALLRWRSSELGLVPPADFIPVAEDSGLIAPIGDWVLSRACAQARRLHLRGHDHVRVAVNLSLRQLQRARRPAETVARVLEETGLDPDRLVLEITESTVADDTAETLSCLEAVRRIGVSLAIDDFGTGYATLSVLRDFPVDYVKIDKSFIAGLPDDAGCAAITRTVIAMAASLGIRVVAEGVETPGQLDLLRAWRCHEAQGFLFSKPVSSGRLRGLLERGPLRGD